MIKRTLGFHVDFDRTLGAQYEEARREGLEVLDVTPERVDSLIEKSETAIKMIHRPIVESHTANKAEIIRNVRGHQKLIGRPLDLQTYGHMQILERSRLASFSGRVSSYNLNTFRGRIYIEDNQRPIPFELSNEARDGQSVGVIARSLARNADSWARDSDIDFRAIKILTRTGRVKSLIIKEVS